MFAAAYTYYGYEYSLVIRPREQQCSIQVARQDVHSSDLEEDCKRVCLGVRLAEAKARDML